MNIEVFSYSIQTAILGILIVFTTLVVLWFLMEVLKRVFDKPAPNKGAGGGTQAPGAKPAASGPSGQAASAPRPGESALWLAAAVAAFFAAEDEGSPYAGAWVSSGAFSEKSDPWIARAAFDKTIL